jgi:ATP-dependent DNA helicase RecQ
VEVMQRRATVRLDAPPFARGRREAAPLPEMDEGLYGRLLALRKELSQEAGIAPFMVAHNAVLERMAAAAPVTADDLLAVKGVGEQSLERFGYRFLEVIRDHVGR